ncbi:MAG: sugar kinase [Nitrospirae bacterium]|nr:sugar kinase [Nitrospirota bacterium]MBI3604468.1 sugar kinase [Nitrospirota bacterium]
MSLLVVGSVAFDSVKTPFGAVEDALGGSATFFSASASYFTKVNLVAVIGSDFPEEHLSFLKSKGINLDGLQKVEGKTFRWKGEYGFSLNEAKTLDTQLNVFQTFKPVIPPSCRDAEIVFLANIDPDLQYDVLEQVRRPKWVACDTMNYWISGKKDSLLRILKKVNLLMINDGEARQLANEPNLVHAAKIIRAMGPEILIIKRGEYGALMFNGKTVFAVPAFPLEKIYDPTGAGDTFAGGVMGYLSKSKSFDDRDLRRAIIYGSVMASFNVESFSLDRIRHLTHDEIEARSRAFKELTHFELS